MEAVKRPGNCSPFEPPEEPVELSNTLVKPSEAMRSVSDGGLLLSSKTKVINLCCYKA